MLATEVDPAEVALMIGLICYYLVKSCILVTFLHAFAQKIIVEEREVFEKPETERKFEEPKVNAQRKHHKSNKKLTEAEKEAKEEKSAVQDRTNMRIITYGIESNGRDS